MNRRCTRLTYVSKWLKQTNNAWNFQAWLTKESQIGTRLLCTPKVFLQNFTSASNWKHFPEVFFRTHNFKINNPGGLNYQVCLRTLRSSLYTPDNEFFCSSRPKRHSSSFCHYELSSFRNKYRLLLMRPPPPKSKQKKAQCVTRY